MCGILGLIHPGFDEATTRRFQAGLYALAHRGPDAQGIWQSGEGGPAALLGHRRLSILDLSPQGAQPMHSPDGRFHLVFNGEIYNFLELKRELEAQGERFHSESDTEVLLSGLARFGPDFLERANGMWALALWDEQERTLLLSRDRFGKKPLFFAFTKRGFAFASEMKALFPLLDRVEASPDFHQLSHNLFGYESGPKTPIKGIVRFPAGTHGLFRDDKLSLSRWWNTLDHTIDPPRTFAEAAEQLRALLFDAVRIRLRSDVPVGTALSGGLDSSAVAAFTNAVRIHGGGERILPKQRVFTASYPGAALDEVPFAKQVADHLGLSLDAVVVDPAAAVDRLDDFFWKLEDLTATNPIPFMLLYEAVRKSGVVVSLDGHGADELFGGYHFDFLVALDDAALNPAAVSMILGAYKNAVHDPVQFPTPPKPVIYARRRLGALKRALTGRLDRARSKDELDPRFLALDALNKRLYVSTHDTILPTLLRNYDRYAMASGVEIRMPFMDHRVVSFAFSLPWSMKIAGAFSKAVVRAAAAPWLPHDIAWRKDKIGFNAPMLDWMRGPLKSWFLDLVHSAAFKQSPLVDQHHAQNLVKYALQHPKADFRAAEQAFAAVMPHLWERAVLRPA